MALYIALFTTLSLTFGNRSHAEPDRFLVVSDTTNALFRVTRAGTILRSYAFPGANQEGITLDADGFLYIAQDSGGIVKIRWLKGR